MLEGVRKIRSVKSDAISYAGMTRIRFKGSRIHLLSARIWQAPPLQSNL
ncbi:MAG: hypothetical protein XD70_0221 [Thermovirga lienii]|jgi:hypothetical protein|nr:MAG: hypothetical protein XD70_0221 [Thermovirga lienii]